MSTTIVIAFRGTCVDREKFGIKRSPPWAVILFYTVVLLVIGGGSYFSFQMHYKSQGEVARKPAGISCDQLQISTVKGKTVFFCTPPTGR